jgi:hypothetical protein
VAFASARNHPRRPMSSNAPKYLKFQYPSRGRCHRSCKASARRRPIPDCCGEVAPNERQHRVESVIWRSCGRTSALERLTLSKSPTNLGKATARRNRPGGLGTTHLTGLSEVVRCPHRAVPDPGRDSPEQGHTKRHPALAASSGKPISRGQGEYANSAQRRPAEHWNHPDKGWNNGWHC